MSALIFAAKHIYPDVLNLNLTVIEHGWGERHKLSGSRVLRFLTGGTNPAYVPNEYIWIYAPRDEEELAVVEKVLLAATSYMTGQKAEGEKHD